MDPTHEPTLRALEGLMAGREEPVLAAAVLEPIYESAGEWDRVIAVYEVMQANTEEALRKVELLIAHRRDRGAAAVAPEHGLRRLRARVARRPDEPGRPQAPASGWRPRPATGRSWRRCTPPSSRRSRTRAARSTCCCASRASTRRRPASSTRPSRPTVASSRASPTTRRRWSRSIGCTARTSSGTSWPTSCGARSASPRTIRPSSS